MNCPGCNNILFQEYRLICNNNNCPYSFAIYRLAFYKSGNYYIPIFRSGIEIGFIRGNQQIKTTDLCVFIKDSDANYKITLPILNVNMDDVSTSVKTIVRTMCKRAPGYFWK
jgi:hypothetical protein